MANIPAFDTSNPSGTIAGVKYWEQVGSNSVRVSRTNGTSAERVIWVEWDDWQENQWAMIKTLTSRPLDTTYDGKYYLNFPFRWKLNVQGGTQQANALMALTDIDIQPAFSGRQKGVSTDKNNYASYDYAELRLFYELEISPIYEVSFSMRIQQAINKGKFTFNELAVDGEQASVPLDIPGEDIVIRVRFSDLNERNENERRIIDLSSIQKANTKINSDSVTIRYPGGSAVFPPKSLKFESWELTQEPNFLEYDTVLVMRFNVAPAYLWDIANGSTSGSADYWNRIYETSLNEFVAITPTAYSSTEFTAKVIPTYNGARIL